MAIVKFVTSGCPMNNIFPYVMREEATESRLIDGIGCTPETALEEFRFVKAQFGKEDKRQYYHIVQSFAPDDPVTPELAHELGMRLAEYFPGFQAVVATHENKSHLHNHIILNSVNFETGLKFHITSDEMREVKEYSNCLCREHGLSTVETKCEYGGDPKWKKILRGMLGLALECSETKEDFIRFLREHGIGVRWDEGHKYITFTDPDGHKCRDNKLFDERFLKENLEIYFAMGGAYSPLAPEYIDHRTPVHPAKATMTLSNDLLYQMAYLFRNCTPQTEEEIEKEEEERRTSEAVGLTAAAVILLALRYRQYYEEEEENEERYFGPVLSM